MRASKNLSDIFLRVMATLDSMVKPGAYPQNEVLWLSSRFESGFIVSALPCETFHLPAGSPDDRVQRTASQIQGRQEGFLRQTLFSKIEGRIKTGMSSHNSAITINTASVNHSGPMPCVLWLSISIKNFLETVHVSLRSIVDYYVSKKVICGARTRATAPALSWYEFLPSPERLWHTSAGRPSCAPFPPPDADR